MKWFWKKIACNNIICCATKCFWNRYQRGDQGPDDDLHHTEIGVDTTNVITDIIVPPIGGPNVCRSRSRTFCCPGWHQRDSTGLCLVPQCSSNRCGSNGRCIKPNLCLCEGGKIAAHCGDSGSLENTGTDFFYLLYSWVSNEPLWFKISILDGNTFLKW